MPLLQSAVAKVPGNTAAAAAKPPCDHPKTSPRQFWEYILPGMDAWGYVACTGTNFCLRARALATVGWFPEYTITEGEGRGGAGRGSWRGRGAPRRSWRLAAAWPGAACAGFGGRARPLSPFVRVPARNAQQNRMQSPPGPGLPTSQTVPYKNPTNPHPSIPPNVPTAPPRLRPVHGVQGRGVQGPLPGRVPRGAFGFGFGFGFGSGLGLSLGGHGLGEGLDWREEEIDLRRGGL